MAFTGTATVQRVTQNLVRITGLSLAGAASGTIGFSDKTSAAEVSLGLLPDWQPYEYEGLVSLIDAIEVRQTIVTDVTVGVPVSVVKTGTTHLDFVITMHNDTADVVGPGLEIYIQFAGH